MQSAKGEVAERGNLGVFEEGDDARGRAPPHQHLLAQHLVRDLGVGIVLGYSGQFGNSGLIHYTNCPMSLRILLGPSYHRISSKTIEISKLFCSKHLPKIIRNGNDSSLNSSSRH